MSKIVSEVIVADEHTAEYGCSTEVITVPYNSTILGVRFDNTTRQLVLVTLEPETPTSDETRNLTVYKTDTPVMNRTGLYLGTVVNVEGEALHVFLEERETKGTFTD
jgi:hypothetical protein